jgi:hypothetical protein
LLCDKRRASLTNDHQHQWLQRRSI